MALDLDLWDLPTPEELSRCLPETRVSDLAAGWGELAIFHGEELSTKRAVSVMVSLRSMERETWLDRARPWARLDHPYIHPVYRIDVAGKLPYLVAAPYRASLETALADEDWGDEMGVKAFLEMAEALKHGHARGLAHGQLDAESVLSRADRYVRVAFWGLLPDETGRSLAERQRQDVANLRTLGIALFKAAEAEAQVLALEHAEESISDMISVLAKPRRRSGFGWIRRC